MTEPTPPEMLEDGSLVRVKMYHPEFVSERGPKSRPYSGGPALRLLKKAWRSEDGTVYKLWLADPDRPNDEGQMTYPCPADCDVWPVDAAELGVLF